MQVAPQRIHDNEQDKVKDFDKSKYFNGIFVTLYNPLQIKSLAREYINKFYYWPWSSHAHYNQNNWSPEQQNKKIVSVCIEQFSISLR